MRVVAKVVIYYYMKFVRFFELITITSCLKQAQQASVDLTCPRLLNCVRLDVI